MVPACCMSSPMHVPPTSKPTMHPIIPPTPLTQPPQELWAKKAPPSQQLVGSYRPQPKIPSEREDPPPRPDQEAEAKLVAAADALGALLLYCHQGFVSNRRQQRAGGLGAVELAQKLRDLVWN